MTIRLSADDLIEINEMVGQPGAGVRDAHGIEANAHRPFTSYMGHLRYNTIWYQAAVYLHGIASTQYFQEGNKRTAWTACKIFLQANGVALRDMPRMNKEATVLAAAVDVISIEDVAEWLFVNRVKASDRLDYAVLSYVDDVEQMEPDQLYHQFPARILAHYESPMLVRYAVSSRLSWYAIDENTEKAIHVELECSAGNPALIIDRSIVALEATVARVPVAHWAPRGLQTWNPTFIVTLGVTDSFDGYFKLYIDKELAWEEHASFTIDAGTKDLSPLA